MATFSVVRDRPKSMGGGGGGVGGLAGAEPGWVMRF